MANEMIAGGIHINPEKDVEVDNFSSARKHNIQSVPSFIFGNRVLTGVVAEALAGSASEQAREADKVRKSKLKLCSSFLMCQGR